MNFNSHFRLEGQHAFLSASNSHWVNYDNEKLDNVFINRQNAMRGTQIHEVASQLIRLGIKLPKTKATLNQYVNDAIGYRMTPEQILVYSEDAFGTADAISFRNNLLRIHDLKTGISRTYMRQLEVYAAFFCLEYRFKPAEIKMELRMYKDDDVEVLIPDPMDITMIMDKIITFDKRINKLRMEVL